MYPIDDSKKCSIYNNSFLNDLKPYLIKDTLSDNRVSENSTNQCVLEYEGTNEFGKVDIRISEMKSIIDEQNSSLNDCWLPAFVKNDNHIYSKEVISGNVIGTKLFGIENFISIDEPRFQNWDLLNDSDQFDSSGVALSSDWIINSNLSYLELDYGVLFWYKKHGTNNGERKEYKLSELPSNTRLVPVNDYSNSDGDIVLSKTDVIIKVDNKTVKFLDKTPKDFAYNPPRFNFGSDGMDLSSQNFGTTNYSDLKFYAYYNKNFVGDANNFVLSNGQIWISNGEFYSYFLNSRERDDYRSHRTTKMPSKSYLSPGLYHIYRSIYNALSITRVRNSLSSANSIGTVVYQEKLKKLCSVLATGPNIDKVSINALYDSAIQQSIHTYLNAPAKTNSNDEIAELLSIIGTINTFLAPLSSKVENQTNSYNHIRTPSDLCKKILMKYGSSLKIDKQKIKKIKFKPALANGPHAYFDIGMKTFCDKNLAPSTEDTPTYIYNKFQYNIGDVVIRNSLDIDSDNRLKSQSLRILSTNDNSPKRIDIPWDITIDSKPERSRVNLKKDLVFPFTPDRDGEMRIDFRFEEGADTDVLWQLIDGPQCLKFSNYRVNGRIDFLKRNNISNDSDTIFYIKKEGLYTVQCQITRSAVLKSSDTIRLYIGNCDTSVPARTQEYSYPASDVTKRYNAICTNLRQFAINKMGLVWILDSDVYTVAQTQQQAVYKSPGRLLNQKIGLNFTPQEVRGSSFTMKFETLDTYVKINSVNIEHMRYGSKYFKCKSFYQDKIVRERDSVGSVNNTFVARYYRQDRYPDSSSFYGKGYEYADDGSKKIVNFRQDYGFPEISTVLSPVLKSYGGYSYSVIQSIGVEIPYHPVFQGDSRSLLSLAKLPNGFWGGRGRTDNPIVAKNPASLPILFKRNNMGGANTKIRCHLTDIPITGSTELKKGYFHPNSGWFPSVSNTTDYPEILNNIGSSAYSENGANITSVQRYKMYRYKSYYFRGNGIFDMRGASVGVNTSYNSYASRILVKATQDINAFLSEHAPHHGYRNINGISHKSQENIDDLYIDQYLDVENEDTFRCVENITELYGGIPTAVYGMVPSSLSVTLDTLTIQDLELKINFLNYPNPKNLIFALEIHNPGLPADPDFNKIFIHNKTNSNNTELTEYVTSLNSTNTTTNPNSKIIYLYNQENLDNYHVNFSMIFGDNYSHSIVFSDNNKYDSILSPHNENIKHNGCISPTLSAFGKNDEESAKYKKAIINNSISTNSATLAKFKNIPLKNTSFILRVYVLGNEEKLLAMDNVVNNSELSGLAKFYTDRTSNTIANSICSWDLVVHTEKTKKFNNKNSRCHFDYNNNNTSTLKGYNFIADFTDKEYLLPKVNINAPFDYIANINYYCRYINDDELSRPLTYQQLFFPFVFFSFTPFFTLAGAMLATWQITAQASLGGRSDPLISYLYDLRFQRMQEDLERKYFQPGYEAVAQGYSDKALVMLSKDQIFWYKMEIPIYKYSNSDILKLKKYKYVKLDGINAKKLSLFKFNLVQDTEDLIGLSEVKYTFDTNVTRVGLSVTIDENELKFKDGDVVRLSGQTNTTENGLYCLKAGLWTRFPDTTSIKFLAQNKYSNSTNTNNITLQNIKDKKILMIKGERAFHFFDDGDSITISANEQLENPISDTIQDKYVVNITNGSYTILVLNQTLTNLVNGFIKKNNSNVLLVYSDKETLSDDSQVGKWGLEKSSTEMDTQKPPSLYHTVTGEGNYGYGTPYVDPDIYSSIGYDSNHLEQVYEMLNNNKNNKFKYNDIYITDSNNASTTITFSPSADSRENLLSAFPFAINEYGYIKDASSYILNTSELSEADTQNLKIDLIEDNLLSDKQTYYFMDIKSNKFSSLAPSGDISFENDYYRHIPVQKLSDTQKNSIKDRITFISTTGIPSNQLMNRSASSIDNIPDLITYYNNLSNDPPNCYEKNDNPNPVCRKKEAKQKLSELSAQRNRLLEILEKDTQSSPNVLPMQQIELDTSLWRIKYKHKNYYWFNIDANQTCSLAEEAIPRILEKTEYTCSPIVEFYQYPECNSVCGTTDSIGGIDFEIDRKGAGLTYINKKIDQEKAKYPDITDWSGQGYFSNLIEKEFFLSCEDNLRDTFVTVKETYLYPKLVGERDGLVKDVFNLDSSDKIYMRFRIIPRKLKTIDPIYQRYVYDYNGGLGKEGVFPGGPIYNGLSVWRCVDFSPGDNFGKITNPPDFFKVQNEMIFRAYFGSVDGVEIKNSPISETKEMWEWIPYEYFNGPVLE
jgi:hypothetical protein